MVSRVRNYGYNWFAPSWPSVGRRIFAAMLGVDGADLLGWWDIAIGIGIFRSRASSCVWRVLILVVICASKSDITGGGMGARAVGGDRDEKLCA